MSHKEANASGPVALIRISSCISCYAVSRLPSDEINPGD